MEEWLLSVIAGGAKRAWWNLRVYIDKFQTKLLPEDRNNWNYMNLCCSGLLENL